MTDVQPPSTAVSGPVQLRLPADPAMSRVLRLAASGLASLHGFSIDELEDLKIAVSEVLIVLVEHGGGLPIDVEIHVDSHSFRIDASTEVPRFDADHPDLQLCRTVLASVCAEHDIRLQGERAHIRAVLLRSN
jgi:anti-sigma regulatory factor (Ser/Thr protein kinase)